jgi:tetratricopeptide (TPR) repeat protein
MQPLAKPQARPSRKASSSRQKALTPQQAVRLFVARATDLGVQIDPSRDAASIRRIAELVSWNRVGVQLAAARAKEAPLAQVVLALTTLSQVDAAELELRARLLRGEALRNAGDLEAAARELNAIIGDASRDPHARAEAHRHLGSVYRAQGRPADALLHKEEAVKLFAQLGDRARFALAEGEVGVALVALGRLREARVRHEKAVAAHRELGARKEEGVELSYLGVTLHRLGLLEDARRAHEAALAIHLEMGNTRLIGAEHMHLGYVAHERGELSLATQHLSNAARIFREVKDRALLGVTLSLLGAVAIEAQRFEESGALLEQALVLHAQAKSPRHEAMTRLFLSYHHADLGEHALAVRSLERALSLGRGVVEVEHEAWMLALLGRGAEAARQNVEDTCTKTALVILAVRDAFAGGKAPLTKAKASLPSPGAAGSRVRRAGKLLAMAVAEQQSGLRVAADAAFFVAEDGTQVDLQRRTPLRKALMLLVAERQRAPGAGVSWERVLSAGWPEQRIQPEAGFARVRNALFQLRKLGLGPILVTGDSGYFLDPRVSLQVVGG